MQIQVDYETESTLALFWSRHTASGAVYQLRLADIPWSQVPLAPGRYQIADTSLGDDTVGVLRGARAGAPSGRWPDCLWPSRSPGPAPQLSPAWSWPAVCGVALSAASWALRPRALRR